MPGSTVPWMNGFKATCGEMMFCKEIVITTAPCCRVSKRDSGNASDEQTRGPGEAEDNFGVQMTQKGGFISNVSLFQVLNDISDADD